MTLGRRVLGAFLSAAAAAITAVAVLSASAGQSKAAPLPTISALHRFTGADGMSPQAALVQASDGNLYGTTTAGGDDGNGCVQQCSGTVFKLTQDGQFTLLHTFAPQTNGVVPFSGLVEGPDGYLYGTTYAGGTSNAGTVYKVSKTGQFVKLHDFCTPPACARDSDGRAPKAGLVVGRDGNLYGRTTRGGDASDPDGTIFRISPSGAFSVVFTFKFTPMGAGTDGNLLLGSDGDFYATTTRFIFRISPGGQATRVYMFSISDGGVLELIQTRDGYLYGVVPLFGVILRVSPTGTGFQHIRTLDQTTEGLAPSTLLQASDGNLWGTTAHTDGVDHFGNVYTLRTDGTPIHSIAMRLTDTGGVPYAPLIQGRDGKLYGTASAGGFPPLEVRVNGGTVFVVDPSGGPVPPLAPAPAPAPTPLPATAGAPAPPPAAAPTSPDMPAQPSAAGRLARVSQDTDGTLYLMTGPDLWILLPTAITDADLSALTPVDDHLQGVIPAQPGPTRVVQAGDGTLYVVQGQQVTPLVPDPISADQVASLNQVGELTGVIPAELVVEPLP